MKTVCLFAIVLLSTFFPSLAVAQNRTAVAIAAGPSVPLGRLRDTQSSGADFNVGLIRGSDEAPLGLRLDLTYDRLPGKTVNATKNAERQTLAGTANVVFSFSGYTLKPYFLGGVGAFRMKSKPATPDQKTRFGFDFGLGFTLPVGGHAMFVESRVNSIAQHDAKPLRYIPIVLGFLF